MDFIHRNVVLCISDSKMHCVNYFALYKHTLCWFIGIINNLMLNIGTGNKQYTIDGLMATYQILK